MLNFFLTLVAGLCLRLEGSWPIVVYKGGSLDIGLDRGETSVLRIPSGEIRAIRSTLLGRMMNTYDADRIQFSLGDSPHMSLFLWRERGERVPRREMKREPFPLFSKAVFIGKTSGPLGP